MQGFEAVLLRLAGTVVGALVKPMLSRQPGAGLVANPERPAPRWRRPVELGDKELGRLTEGLAARLAVAADGLPEYERLAAADAVRDAFTATGVLDQEALFAQDLDPDRLTSAVLARAPRAAGLSDAGTALFEELAGLCCRHVVEYVTTLPGFSARADVEVVRRTGELGRALEDVRDRLGPPTGSVAARFEQQYADFVAATYGRLELFGLTLNRERNEWPLDTAYISLAVSSDRDDGAHQEGMGVPRTGTVAVKAEQALSGAGRLLLRGPAGSGKSTLVQWIALNAARRSFGPDLADWNLCVPFVLRLRSFNSPDALPMPEDFLRAARVPLHGSAPAGWAESLLSSGRALVLVDGVDEVPQRLRNRTEAWLRSLITAFPKARYVVTTRPSAVPEEWLAGLGFGAHSLLPMERDDIRAFIAHWHDTARGECLSPAEREQLDTYQTSLTRAVTSRRDLGRIATNPLMCALLCALNRDRRMQLPRARKELYDAALDLLLVRRDTEREITGVEGVYLTRDEQTLLLQRLAYWLIRNGQTEAAREDVVEMVDEWLDAMPQVRAQGSARQVLSHLLIRSGLLREPVRGAVNFVHRTFQDYLGAKAAVEARDFGVLVRNAHDDQWDDVVRMAVGHARPDERARLLKQLLRRADRVKTHRHRLVLLAAACLEHAPELDPSIRTEVEARTAELLPPRSLAQAEDLAQVGELVLELLPEPADLPEAEAAATVRTAALVGGPRALAVIARFREDTRFPVCYQLSDGWGRFDTAEYADAVLSGASLGEAFLHIHTSEQLSSLTKLRAIKGVHLTWEDGIPPSLTRQRDLQRLTLYRNKRLVDLTPLAVLQRLTHLGIFDCPEVSGIRPLTSLPLRSLYLSRVRDGLSLSPLSEIATLRGLTIDFAADIRCVGDIPAHAGLTSLGLGQRARFIDLDGLERWPDLTTLSITGDEQNAQLARQRPLPPLKMLQLLDQSALRPDSLLLHQEVTGIYLTRCRLTGGLGPLRSLPALTRLDLSDCSGPLDLSPLAELDQLTIEISRGTNVQGAELIPPERLTFA
ncbi:NACHT domain-containing protein [Streptomyces sp. A3M-1-3]|uniref:NACHT domain-containing protein n=1 Tax=Streptomyces sp. A3M-1-3 TaxID=2962044 RepID=UPI0020B799A9|nr:NACHT domain-containing protein [Streptomyces sp. A3M-1-3]MCP3821267.1 NACHT domain-containing protein [Streptomyces sp. A3M-1-3]